MPTGQVAYTMGTHFLMMNVFIVFVTCFCATDGAKILGIFPMPAKSHMILYSALMKELASRGHHVTVFSPYPEKNRIENFTDIEFKAVYSDVLQNTGMSDMLNMDGFNSYQQAQFYWELGISLCELFTQDEAFQKLVSSSKQQFDVIITSAFFNDCIFGISYMLDTPTILICPFSGAKWMDEWVGNPSHYAYVPQVFSDYSDKMNLWQRMLNTLSEIYMKLGRTFYVIPRHDAILKRLFNSSNIPSISISQNMTALLMINQHFSIGYPRPLLPNVVEVGGMHISPPKKLKADLQTFMDESPDGVIYFSMGSNLRSSNMKNKTKTALLEAFSKLKQRVLWKWETDSLPGQPSNVKLGKWLPQSDILAHPKMRLFITHGGLLSTQEAVYHGVPLVGIPIYGDQRLNMASVLSRDIGIQMDYENITAESMTWAITEVLNNQRYREKIQRLSLTFRDQPQTPLQQAVFWTEYVIRHKGAPHMRSAALDLTWYQYFLLDLIAVLALVVVCAAYAIYITSRAVIKILFHIPATNNRKYLKKE